MIPDAGTPARRVRRDQEIIPAQQSGRGPSQRKFGSGSEVIPVTTLSNSRMKPALR
jgi:hypothetical protein